MPSREKVLALIALVLAAASVLLQAMLPSAVAQPLQLQPGPGSSVVEINLEVPMEVHCKGEKYDFGRRMITPHDTYKFIIPQSSTALYSCEFVFDNVIHTFDIYNEGRDGPCPADGDHYWCSWFVQGSGPCLNYSDHNCYPWNN